jgi:hypothetical protein
MSTIKLPPLPTLAGDDAANYFCHVVSVEEAQAYATAYAEEAVRQALVEAAAICNRKFIAMAEGGFPREASTARKLTAEIVALLPENRDG